MTTDEDIERERARLDLLRKMEDATENALRLCVGVERHPLVELSLEIQKESLPYVTRIMRAGAPVCIVTGMMSPSGSTHVLFTEMVRL